MAKVNHKFKLTNKIKKYFFKTIEKPKFET